MSALHKLEKLKHGGGPQKLKYVGNNDRMLSKNVYHSSSVDIQMAESYMLLNIRIDRDSGDFQLLVRVVGEEKKVQRAWVSCEKLEGEDGRGIPILPKLLKDFLAFNQLMVMNNKQLKPVADAKTHLAKILLEKISYQAWLEETSRPQREVQDTIEAPSAMFLNKYGGRIKDLVLQEDLKSDRYKEFVNEYCQNKIAQMKESMTVTSYKQFDYIRLLYLLRQFIYDTYMAKVCLQPNSVHDRQ